MTWNDAIHADCWHTVFKQGDKWYVTAAVGEDRFDPPAFGVARELHSEDLEYRRLQTARAYRELARGLHRLANKATLEAEKIQPTPGFETPIEQLAINLMNEKFEWGHRHGGGALTIAEKQLADHLRTHGWEPPPRPEQVKR